MSEITAREVDRYRQAKVREGEAIRTAAARGRPLIEEYVDERGQRRRRPRRALSATSINKTITRMGQILEVAVEYGLIDANAAKGRRRRLKTQRAIPEWLDRAEHIEALLAAASELDEHAKRKGGHGQKGGATHRRALLATLRVEPAAYKAQACHSAPDDYVFATEPVPNPSRATSAADACAAASTGAAEAAASA